MKFQSKLISLAIVLTMCVPYFGSLPALAIPYDLMAQDVVSVRDNGSIGTLNANTAVVDSRSGDVKRMFFMRMDFSEYKNNLEYLNSIKLQLTTHGDAGNANYQFSVYIFTPEQANYTVKPDGKTVMTFKQATDMGLTGDEPDERLVYTSPKGLQKDTTYTTDDLLPRIKDYFAQNPDETLIGFKTVSNNGAYSFKNMGLGVENALKPHLVVDQTAPQDLFKLADEEVRASWPTAVSNDIQLPSSVESVPAVEITWESLTPESISSSGTIVSRPGFSEEETAVRLKAVFSYMGEHGESIYDLKILKTGSFAGIASSENEGKVKQISFDVTEAVPETAGYLLKIPNAYLESTKEYTLYSGFDEAEDGEITRFIPDDNSEFTMVDVSRFVMGTSVTFSITENAGETIADSNATFILEGHGEDLKAGIAAVDSIDMGDLSAVTEDLYLPTSVDGVDITWISSNEEYLTGNGRVDRPFNNEGDAKVVLTAKYEGPGGVYTRAYLVTILKQETGGSTFPELKDPQHISDGRFFGTWNELTEKWDTKPILRYDLYPKLSTVENFVKKGDYDKAKDALLAYYRATPEATQYKVPVADKSDITNYLRADMLAEKVSSFLQMDNVVGVASDITPEWGYHAIDINVKAKSMKGTIFLLDSDMDGSSVEIQSKENAENHPPYLEVVVDGVKRTLPVSGDTYIGAGANRTKNYGKEEILYCREAASSPTFPIGDDTKRAYFNFDVSELTGTIESMKFYFYARSDAGNKKVFLFTSQNESTNFNENALTWSGHYNQVFNFKETGFLFPSPGTGAGAIQDPSSWNCEYEWLNWNTRMYQVEYLLGRYKATNDELFAYRALEMTMEMYTQQPKANYPRTLETGWRTEYLCHLFYGTLNSSCITPELLTAQLKYIYIHQEHLRNSAPSSAANQNSAARIGFLRLCRYMPETLEDGWMDQCLNRLLEMYEGKIVGCPPYTNPDGSYGESTSGYMDGTVNEMVEGMEMLRDMVGEDNEVYRYMVDEAYGKLINYMMDLCMPYGMSPAWGDGGRGGMKSFLSQQIKIFPNKEIEFLTSEGKGTGVVEPDHTSKLYSDKAIAFLKDGWLPNNLGAVINADLGGSHAHADDLAVDVCAYGAYLLVDAGNDSYSPGSAMTKTVKKTLSHNTIEITREPKKDENGKITKTYSEDQVVASKSSPQKMTLTANKLFDFVDAGSEKIYPEFSVNRKLLFLHNGYWIVSDYIDAPEGNHTYKQAWHSDIKNNMTIDPVTKAMKTHFNGPNIQVVPADPEKTDARIEQIYQAHPTGATLTDYVRYCREDVSGPQTFDTVLYPDKAGEDTYVNVERIEMPGTDTITATALKIDIGLDNAYYYTSNEAEPTSRAFGSYATDGQMAYVETDSEGKTGMIAMTQVKTLTKKDGENEIILVSSSEKMADLGIEWNMNKMKLFTEDGKLPEDGVVIHSDVPIEKVTLNGQEVEYIFKDGAVTTNGTPKKEVIPDNPLTPGSPSGTGNKGGNGNAANPLVSKGEEPEEQPENPENPEEEAVFTDVAGHWAEKEILDMYKRSIVEGVGDKLFLPEKNVTRAEFVAILARALALPASGEFKGIFTDVKADDWFAGVAESARNVGIISGYDDGSFAPNNIISRQEMAKILVAAANYLKIPVNIPEKPPEFQDAEEFDGWAEQAVAVVGAMGLMQGMNDNTFSPRSNVTRAQATVVVSRLLGLTGGEAE